MANKYLIVGDGRVARHLDFYLRKKGCNLTNWSRNRDSIGKLDADLKYANIVLIAISDGAIDEFILENKTALQGKKLVHFSGALSSDLAFGCHPLMTFTEELYSYEVYPTIMFCSDEAPYTFKEIFPMLENSAIVIPKSDKSKIMEKIPSTINANI